MPNQPSREATLNPCCACRTVIALAALMLYASGADADESGAPMFSFSGFGTLGMAHSSEDQADFISSGLKPNGAGFSHRWSADVDSLIGAQVSANLTPELSAVLQVISEQNYDNTYRPHVEWANIKYQFTPDFSIRAGRIVLPAFLVSDYRKVGYANPWVRPPVEIYSLVPINNSDGVDASYRLRFSAFTNTVQANYGNTKPSVPPGGAAKAKDVWGISDSAEYGAATVHISYIRTKLTLDAFKPLFDGFRQFGPEGVALADKYDPNNTTATFIGLGGMCDPGGWLVAVVSSKSSITALSANQVADIFLGKANRFPDGSQAMPIDQAEGSAARDAFYAKLTGKSAAQMKAHWSKIIFTGRGQPPQEVSNSLEVKKLIVANPNVIGYIEENLVDGRVKVLLAQ